jgi:S1-C subfamily serine protease
MTEGQEHSEQHVAVPHQGIHQKLFVTVFLIALGGGFIGAVVYDALRDYQNRHKQSVATAAAEAGTSAIKGDDGSLTALVAKNSPGVVSIVAKKPVTAVQGSFPFYFLPPANNNGGDQGTEGSLQVVGSGSGFFVTSDGIIVTNKHVVSDTTAQYTVLMPGSDEEHKATVLARDPVNDIAFLKVEGKNFPTLKLGDSDTLEVGETAIAIGNSLGEFANSVSRGIISGKQRSLSAGSSYGETEMLSGIIQTDAAINPGNSGGPLFNMKGEVIGVNVAMAQGAENIGFALPINQVKLRLAQVEKDGQIHVPYLGVRYVILSDALKKKHKLPYAYGALILRGRNVTDFAVAPGSPADKAGLKENDIILSVNGQKVTAEMPLANLLGSLEVGSTVTLEVYQGGAEKKLSVVLEEQKATE